MVPEADYQKHGAPNSSVLLLPDNMVGDLTRQSRHTSLRFPFIKPLKSLLPKPLTNGWEFLTGELLGHTLVGRVPMAWLGDMLPSDNLWRSEGNSPSPYGFLDSNPGCLAWWQSCRRAGPLPHFDHLLWVIPGIFLSWSAYLLHSWTQQYPDGESEGAASSSGTPS